MDQLLFIWQQDGGHWRRRRAMPCMHAYNPIRTLLLHDRGGREERNNDKQRLDIEEKEDEDEEKLTWVLWWSIMMDAWTSCLCELVKLWERVSLWRIRRKYANGISSLRGSGFGARWAAMKRRLRTRSWRTRWDISRSPSCAWSRWLMGRQSHTTRVPWTVPCFFECRQVISRTMIAAINELPSYSFFNENLWWNPSFTAQALFSRSDNTSLRGDCGDFLLEVVSMT